MPSLNMASSGSGSREKATTSFHTFSLGARMVTSVLISKTEAPVPAPDSKPMNSGMKASRAELAALRPITVLDRMARPSSTPSRASPMAMGAGHEDADDAFHGHRQQQQGHQQQAARGHPQVFPEADRPRRRVKQGGEQPQAEGQAHEEVAPIELK